MGPTHLESEKQIVCWIQSLNIERNLFTELDGDSNREPKMAILLEMLLDYMLLSFLKFISYEGNA